MDTCLHDSLSPIPTHFIQLLVPDFSLCYVTGYCAKGSEKESVSSQRGFSCTVDPVFLNTSNNKVPKQVLCRSWTCSYKQSLCNIQKQAELLGRDISCPYKRLKWVNAIAPTQFFNTKIWTETWSHFSNRKPKLQENRCEKLRVYQEFTDHLESTLIQAGKLSPKLAEGPVG